MRTLMQTKSFLHLVQLYLIDQTTDPLDPTPPCKTANGRLSDALEDKILIKWSHGLGSHLDVVPQHLAMSLGTSLAQSLSTFSTSSHDLQSAWRVQ